MNERLVSRYLFPLHERLKGKPTFRLLAELEAKMAEGATDAADDDCRPTHLVRTDVAVQQLLVYGNALAFRPRDVALSAQQLEGCVHDL